MSRPTASDVGIVGGGLAGLTLALQLRRRHPELAITVLERRRHPVPIAAHKVGESTVEIGAHYLSQTIGLEDHLKEAHIRKYGLRLFFQGRAGDRSADLAQADEVGVSRLMAVPSYQLDRGILENELGERANAAGIEFRTGCRVATTTLEPDGGGSGHEIRYRDDAAEQRLRCRWLVDAASRASPLKRSRGVAKSNAHDINAAWFRVPGRIRVDDWSADASWRERCPQFPRWHSTNHLMGPGYWVWLIPLSSGSTSIGIVADPALHPLETFNTHALALAWLRRHEPRCGEAVAGLEPMDFRYLRHFSHDCAQVFSADRWALTGEAGVFLDPFYSPGNDFIAISNGYVTELISEDLAGRGISRRSRAFQQFYFSFYQSTLALYEGLYPGFGDRHLMALKTVWDYAFYWGVLALLSFTGGLVDERVMLGAAPRLLAIQRRNVALQARFRDRAAQRINEPGRGIFVDQRAIPCLLQFNEELYDPLADDALLARLDRNVTLLLDLADRIERRTFDPGLRVDGRERELLGDLGERLA